MTTQSTQPNSNHTPTLRPLWGFEILDDEGEVLRSHLAADCISCTILARQAAQAYGHPAHLFFFPGTGDAEYRETVE